MVECEFFVQYFCMLNVLDNVVIELVTCLEVF